MRSRLWGVWLADLIFCGGSAVPIGFAARYELVCHHQVRIIDSRCRWVRSGATGVQITQVPLNRLQGVDIIEQWRSSRGRRYRVYQVHLQTTGGSIAFGQFTRDRQSREAIAERIHHSSFFTAAPTSPFNISRRQPLVGVFDFGHRLGSRVTPDLDSVPRCWCRFLIKPQVWYRCNIAAFSGQKRKPSLGMTSRTSSCNSPVATGADGRLPWLWNCTMGG